MSRFLAPIHNWLFNKIKLYEELEKNIITSYKAKYDDDSIEKIVKDGIEKYGGYTEDRPLEEIIDLSNIHGWLQNNIMVEESRSAYVFAKILEIYNDKSVGESEASKQGRECAQSITKVSSPENVFERLNEFVLEGMPCDRVNSIVERDEEKIVWVSEKCIHWNNYIRGEGNVEFMYELRDVWVKSFVENINSGYIYNVERYNEKSKHCITKK